MATADASPLLHASGSGRPNPPRNAARWVACALSGLLAACEPAFDVDFVATPLPGDGEVLLRLEGVELRKTGGGTERIDRGSTGEYRIPGQTDPVARELISNSDIDGGEYAGLRLRLADPAGQVARVGQTRQDIEIGNADGDEAAVAFMVDSDEDERISLLVVLDLVLSLSREEGEPGFTLDPRIRAMETQDIAAVRGSIPATRFINAACTAGTTLVYAFAGKDITPDERDGSGVEPLATAEIRRNGAGTAGTYRLDPLPPGDYTLAFTCQGERENGRLAAEDGIEFFEGAQLKLEPGDDLTVDFEA